MTEKKQDLPEEKELSAEEAKNVAGGSSLASFKNSNSTSTCHVTVIRRIMLAAILVLAFAACALAQDQEFPNARVAAGIVDLKSTMFNRFGVLRGPFTDPRDDGGFHNPGVWVDLEWDPIAWLGIANYTGFYYLDRTGLIADIPGAKLIPARLAGGRIIPYVVAGFGFGYYNEHWSIGHGSYTSLSAAGRYGIGTDMQLNQLWGLRVEAGKMVLNSTKWTPYWNLAGGVVFSIF